MSSITRQNYQSFSQSIQELWMHLQQYMESCKQGSLSGCSTGQISWQQFEEDVNHVFRTLVELSEILVEEWATIDKLEIFVKNLELDNTELFEQKNQYILKLEECQFQKMELNRIILELRKDYEIQHQKKSAQTITQQIHLQSKYLVQCQQLEHELSRLRSQIQKISLQKGEITEELSLKNTEIELAQLVIQDLRANKQKLQNLCSTVYHEKQETNSFNSLESRSNSHKKNYKRHSSLLEDLTQSQLVYEPRINSQMFKSTQTIQEAIEDNNYEISNIQLKSCIKDRSKRSKAISVCLIPQVSHSYTQTQCQKNFYDRYYEILKDRIVSQRIKR